MREALSKCKVSWPISTSWNPLSESWSSLQKEEEKSRAIEWTRRKTSECSELGKGNCCETGWWNKIYIFFYGWWLKNLKALILQNTRNVFLSSKWERKLEVGCLHCQSSLQTNLCSCFSQGKQEEWVGELLGQERESKWQGGFTFWSVAHGLIKKTILLESCKEKGLKVICISFLLLHSKLPQT